MRPVPFAYGPNSELIAEFRGTLLNNDETIANMCLIASAPELLSALESCLKVVDAYRRISGGDGDLSAASARTAIAKARGESC